MNKRTEGQTIFETRRDHFRSNEDLAELSKPRVKILHIDILVGCCFTLTP